MFSFLIVCFHIIWSRPKNLTSFCLHSSVIVKPIRSTRKNSLCSLLHGLSEMILARTGAFNERNFETDTWLGLQSVRPELHSFNSVRMRNKHRQSHNFWSPKSSQQIMHKTSVLLTNPTSRNAKLIWNIFETPRTPSFLARPVYLQSHLLLEKQMWLQLNKHFYPKLVVDIFSAISTQMGTHFS